jgi:hypothetical protein
VARHHMLDSNAPYLQKPVTVEAITHHVREVLAAPSRTPPDSGPIDLVATSTPWSTLLECPSRLPGDERDGPATLAAPCPTSSPPSTPSCMSIAAVVS